MNGAIAAASEELGAMASQQSFLTEHFDTIITVAITILGFVVTYLMTKKSLSDEIKKDKISRTMDTLRELPYEICQLMEKMLQSKGKGQGTIVKEYREMMAKVIAYGSKDAVKIAIKIQQISHQTSENAKEGMSMLAGYSLLITQIKYDSTSEAISPDSWLKLKMNDYPNIEAEMTKTINRLVDELGLNRKFLV